MVNAETHCKCQTCGRTFVMRKSCPDEIAATKFFVYADLNYYRCPVCYKKYKREEEKARSDGFFKWIAFKWKNG